MTDPLLTRAAMVSRMRADLNETIASAPDDARRFLLLMASAWIDIACGSDDAQVLRIIQHLEGIMPAERDT